MPIRKSTNPSKITIKTTARKETKKNKEKLGGNELPLNIHTNEKKIIDPKKVYSLIKKYKIEPKRLTEIKIIDNVILIEESLKANIINQPTIINNLKDFIKRYNEAKKNRTDLKINKAHKAAFYTLLIQIIEDYEKTNQNIDQRKQNQKNLFKRTAKIVGLTPHDIAILFREPHPKQKIGKPFIFEPYLR